MTKKKDKKKKKKVKKVKEQPKRQVKQKVRKTPQRGDKSHTTKPALIVRNWTPEALENGAELDPTNHLEFHINGNIYRVSIDEEYQALRFDKLTSAGHIIQPLGVNGFMFK